MMGVKRVNGNLRHRGNMLLVAIVMTTIISLMLAMAMQPANTATQRWKERELVYRGQHLAQGIKRFYGKYGRFPFDLKELIEQEPRFVRQLYKDPMSKEGEWVLVYLSATDQNAIKGLNQALGRAARAIQGQEEGKGQAQAGEVNSQNIDDNKPGLSRVDSVFNQRRQQITGIRSSSTVEGFMVRDDSRIYNDWLFTALPKQDKNAQSLLDQVKQAPQAERP